MTQTKIKSKMVDWSTQEADKAATRTALGLPNTGPLTGFRNKIINGNFDIWQRAASQTASGYGSADRWSNSRTGSTNTTSRQAFTLGQTDVPGEPALYIRHVVTSSAGASNYVVMSQPIEDVRTLAGKNATLSFWAKADAAKPITVEIGQNFGTGGSPSATVYATPQKISLTTSWAKYTLTFAIPSISGKTLGSDGNNFLSVSFWMDAGSSFNARTETLGQQSGTFEFAQIQFEEGTSATPFEERPRATEFGLCERYYQRTYVNCYCTNDTFGTYSPDYYFPMALRTMMRATPSMSRESVSDSSVTCTLVAPTTGSFSVSMEMTGTMAHTQHWAVASAEL